jgi:anti-sigma factor RsiW
MVCQPEMLQEYLDNELNEEDKAALHNHLSGCRTCRQELSRLRLMWSDLAWVEEPASSFAISLVRQQAVTSALRKQAAIDGEAESLDLWECQKLAWRPLLQTAAQMPGIGIIGNVAERAWDACPRAALQAGRALWRLYNQKGKGGKR